MSKSQKKAPFFTQEIINYGPYFTPEYESLGIRFALNGKTLRVSALQEFFLCRLHKLTEQGELDQKFKRNFYASFKSLLSSPGSDVDPLSFEDFFKIKPQDDDLQRFHVPKPVKEDLEKHRFAKVDGKMLEVQNPVAEYHTIFNDRAGLKTGTIKLRVRPEDMTVNTSVKDLRPPPLHGRQIQEDHH